MNLTGVNRLKCRLLEHPEMVVLKGLTLGSKALFVLYAGLCEHSMICYNSTTEILLFFVRLNVHIPCSIRQLHHVSPGIDFDT